MIQVEVIILSDHTIYIHNNLKQGRINGVFFLNPTLVEALNDP
jgi:hypothetical protein